MIDAAARLARTICHLPPQQLLAQVRYRARPRPRPRQALHCAPRSGLWLPRSFGGPSAQGYIDETEGLHLLNEPVFRLGEGWTAAHRCDLFRYSLHYHGWLESIDGTRARAWLSSWLNQHQHGIGWDPYPTAMRLLYWLGWLARDEAGDGLRRALLRSITDQAHHLGQHVEHHLGGNHVWTNHCALLAVALAARNHDGCQRWSKALLTDLEHQLTPDGIHRERSPTYHLLLTEQLAAVASLARDVAPRLATQLESTAHIMWTAAQVWQHPDGDIALWGDSVLDAPAAPRQLKARLGSVLSSNWTQRAGFGRQSIGPWTILFNRGDIAMPHQPGHTHADALSLELSHRDERILTDAGVGTYDRGPQRRYARSSAAHNTLTVADADHHEMWASHRIGGRATIDALDDPSVLGGIVRGWDTPMELERRIVASASTVTVLDRSRTQRPFRVRFHVNGRHDLSPTHRGWRLITAAGAQLYIDVSGGLTRIEPSAGWIGFNRPAPRHCIVVDSAGFPICTRWISSSRRAPCR